MFIMTQNSECIVNSTFLVGFEVKDSQVHGVNANGVPILLGTYKNSERAKEILMDILINIDSMRYEMPYI